MQFSFRLSPLSAVLSLALLVLVPRKNQDSIGVLYPWDLEFWNLVFLGKGYGKVLGELVTKTTGNRVTNICVKNTENT